MPDTLEKKFTSPESLLKSYTSLERMLGQDKVVVPGPNSTPEEKAAFFDRLGRPAKPEEYGVKMPEKIGDKAFPKELWRDDRAKAFTARAHELGLSKEQVAGLVEFDATAGLADHEANTAASEKAKGDAITALKTEWGANYDANLKLANAAAKQVGGEDLLKHPLANDPMFIRAMAKVGAAIVEDPAAGARGTSHAQTNPQSEWAKIKGDRTHPYWVKGHPNHTAARAHVQKLFEQMHPEPTAGR